MNRDEYAALAEKESAAWADMSHLDGISWLHAKTIDSFVNRRITGRPDVNWFDYTVFKYRLGRGLQGPGMSLGSNDGLFDRQIMQAKLCTRFDGYDISKGAIEAARKAAAAEGLDIDYHCCDLNFAEIPHENYYTLVVAVMALHHVDRLDDLYSKVARSMRPEGIFAFNEYIGPNRFQISDRQLEAINDCMKILPARLRRRSLDGMILERIERVNEKALIAHTPFEAIRSEEIMPLLEKHFTILERHDYGGSILSWLLNYLIPNFNEESEEDRAILELLCRVDAMYDRSGEPSDHTAVIATKKFDEANETWVGTFESV